MSFSLSEIRTLRERGDTDAYLAAARELAEREPGHVDAQIEAAYACDRYGAEEDAIVYYEAAWKLGVPDDRRRGFLVGYGSTMRNVGRSAEAIELQERAIAEYPDYVPFRAFLALSLLEVGRPKHALASMLDALLLTESDRLDVYARALRGYAEALRDS